MRKLLIFVLLLGGPTAKLGVAQGNFAALVTGTAAGDIQFQFLDRANTALGNNFKADSGLFPGLEIRFNQDGRVTPAMYYSRWKTNTPRTHRIDLADELGNELVSTDLIGTSEIDVLVGRVYVNVLTRGPVRPFVTIGAGLARIESAYRFDTWLAPEIAKGLSQNSFTDPGVNFNPATGIISLVGSEKTNWGIIPVGFGTNFFPHRHIVGSVALEFQNIENFGDKTLVIGAGFTW